MPFEGPAVARHRVVVARYFPFTMSNQWYCMRFFFIKRSSEIPRFCVTWWQGAAQVAERRTHDSREIDLKLLWIAPLKRGSAMGTMVRTDRNF